MQGVADEIDRYEAYIRWYEDPYQGVEDLAKVIYSLLPGDCKNMTAKEAYDYCVSQLYALKCNGYL